MGTRGSKRVQVLKQDRSGIGSAAKKGGRGDLIAQLEII